MVTPKLLPSQKVYKVLAVQVKKKKWKNTHFTPNATVQGDYSETICCMSSKDFHSRSAPKLSTLEKSYDTSLVDGAKSSSTPWTLPAGTYVGSSTCNRYTSAIGSGQKVLSYTYYTPWKSMGGR